MRYIVERTDVIDPSADSKEWDKANVGTLNPQIWKDRFAAPETTFKMLRGPEGISVLMNTKEKNLLAAHTDENGAICEDSCMEFFYKPSPWDHRYINFEINPAKVMHIGIGSDRYDRELLFVDRSIFNVESIAEDGNWTLKLYVPDVFILTYYEKTANVCRANFYKCGNKTEFPHYGVWNPVELEKPDFHLADFFGTLEIK